MSIFQKVTLASLRKNKTRTTVTIIGIILSAAMVCAVTSLITSVQRYMEEATIYQYGSWHGSAESVDWKTYERIQRSDKVKKAAYGQQLGYAKLENCANPNKPYLYLMGAGEGYNELLPIHVVEGRLPQTDSELMLPQHLAENGGLEYELGDTLTLALGNRLQDGYVMNQWNPCFYNDENGEQRFDEVIEVRETRTFTVVGICERMPYEMEDLYAPGYTAFTVADVDAAASIAYDVYFQMQDQDEIYAFVKDNALEGRVNSEVLLTSGTARYSSFYVMLYSLAAIVIGLIMFGSISLIYNAFSISVSERTKQFGLLSSIGATKKQLRKMVFFEALVVSAIGIPIGIVVGILGIGTTLLLIGEKMGQLFGSGAVLRLHVSSAAMLIACLVALVTVFISAWIPSVRATRVSAVEAIRQSMDVQAKRPVRTSRLTYRLFGLPGVLASKHYKRSKKKYRATVVSLFMSIVLFVSTAAFSDYLMESVAGGLRGPEFDLAFWSDESELDGSSPDELLTQLKTTKGVTDGAYTRNWGQRCRIDRSFLTDDAPEMVDIGIYFVDDASFRKLLAEYGLSETEFMNPEAPLAVAIDRNTRFDYLQERYVTQQFLRSDTSEATLKEGEGAEPKMIRSGKTIYEKPFYILGADAELIYLYPMCAEKAIQDSSEAYTFMFTSKDHGDSYTAMKKLMKEAGLNNSSLVDIAARTESRRNVVLILQVFAYGFIVLISMIAAANVFNTISTNMALRRREFAMLKSVGMTARGLNRMINFECLLYGSKALLYGLPAAAGVTYLIYRAVSNGYSTGFRLPWTAVGIAVCSVFAVVFVTMMYAMSKIKKENPIDALRNENL